MGQCWSRPRRRFKIRPLDPQEMSEGWRGRFEANGNKTVRKSSDFVFEKRANSERSLNSLNTSNSVCTSRKLPPLPPDVMLKNAQLHRKMYEETLKWKEAEKEQELLEREFSKGIKTSRKQQKQSFLAGNGKPASNKVSPFWKFQDVPVKPPALIPEDVRNGMKDIDSEMSLLLKPDEKYRPVVFTVEKVDMVRFHTPSCVPQRLLKQPKEKMDRVQLLEKQRDAERRRNANIAKRVQSARQKSGTKNVLIIHETKQDKNLQDKMESAHARRSEAINHRVEVAKKSGSLRKHPEDGSKYKDEVKVKVDLKMKQATDRRSEILGQKSHAAKTESRTELVNEREKEIADVQRSKLEVKLNKIKENKERMLKRKLRLLEFEEKKRELARKTLARQRQEHEDLCETFYETETYEGDDDLGEHDWD